MFAAGHVYALEMKADQKKPATKLKDSVAILLTLITIVYFLATLPTVREIQPIKLLRQGFQALGWKTQWSMFAPTPQRSFPVTLTVRFYPDLSGSQYLTKKIFDFYHPREGFFMKSADKNLWAPFYNRLWVQSDCRTNCEQFLDTLVLKQISSSGATVAKAELVWEESRTPNISEGILSLEEISKLPKKEVIGFSKNYEP